MDRKKGNQLAEAGSPNDWEKGIVHVKLFKTAVYRDAATFGKMQPYVAVQKGGVMKWGAGPVEEGDAEPDFTG